jgi:hypothetical protein
MNAEQMPAPRARTADFSPQAVSRAVLQATLQKPYVLYPTAVGVLGGLAAVVLGPSLLFLAPAAAGLTLGFGGWALDFALRRDKLAADYINRLRESLAGRVDDTIARLRDELKEMNFEAGLAQMDELKKKFSAFGDLLRRKLNPQEVTFTRYLGMTEQVFLGGLDNLGRISDTLKGLSAIDVEHIQRRLTVLHTDGVDSPAQDREIATLNERLSLRAQQRDLIDRLLSENETAMTQIDHVMAAIANLDTSTVHATMSMEAAMQELKHLADRAPALSTARQQS